MRCKVASAAHIRHGGSGWTCLRFCGGEPPFALTGCCLGELPPEVAEDPPPGGWLRRARGSLRRFLSWWTGWFPMVANERPVYLCSFNAIKPFIVCRRRVEMRRRV